MRFGRKIIGPCEAMRLRYAHVVVAIALAMCSAARSAELDGVILPDSQRRGTLDLRLNGIGLRTYSVLHLHIYVAGLYLTRPSRDADQILRSDDVKILEIRFLHDVTAEQGRKAWRDGFDQNCSAPCPIASRDIERFLAAVPAMSRGDSFTLEFTAGRVEVTANRRHIGTIADPQFARLILATFIGPRPATQRLKSELLGLG